MYVCLSTYIPSSQIHHVAIMHFMLHCELSLVSVYIIIIFIFYNLVGVLNKFFCPAVCTSGAVRLVGGASSNKGILEYCHHGAWSSVCANLHDEEATVACKQLGFTGSPSKIHV